MRNKLGVIAAILVASSAGADTTMPPQPADAAVVSKQTLKVLTLNMAHGRKSAMNQMLQTGETTRRNIEEIAELLTRVDADLVGLQEADAPSRWSGQFDHVQAVADAAAYPFTVHSVHTKNWMSDFGTAVLSKHSFAATLSHSFEPSPPTLTKGFSVASIDWNPGSADDEPLRVHFLSVHLDFSRRKVRDAQIAEMVEVMSGLEGIRIIVGDFNADAQKEGSVVRYLAERFGLQMFEPEATNLGTYKNGKSRLDWILISPELDFVEHVVLPDIVSDHSAVVAVVALKED